MRRRWVGADSLEARSAAVEAIERLYGSPSHHSYGDANVLTRTCVLLPSSWVKGVVSHVFGHGRRAPTFLRRHHGRLVPAHSLPGLPSVHGQEIYSKPFLYQLISTLSVLRSENLGALDMESCPDADFVAVSGWEGRYLISRDGQVYALPYRSGRSGRLAGGRSLKANLCKVNGYLRVALRQPDGKQAVINLHYLVAKAYVGNPDPECFREVNHKNGLKTDCRAENLEWTSRSQNMAHAYRTGLARCRFPYLRGCNLIAPKHELPWEARVMHLRRSHRIGKFSTGLEAATAYDDFIKFMNIPAEPNDLKLLASKPEMTTIGWFQDPGRVPPSPR